jgi:predicted TIM-barrel fold metal-dependent hydrolase
MLLLCCSCVPTPSTAPAAARGASKAPWAPSDPSLPHDFLAPIVDHHQHLLSPALATLWNEKLTAASLPPDVAELVVALEGSWNNEGMLAELYEEDSVLMAPPSWEYLTHGRAAIAARLAHLFRASYKLAPASVHTDGAAGYLVLYLERPRGGVELPFAEALLMIQRDGDHKWRVATEALRVPGPEVYSAFEAKDLLTLLDQAGIRRAVVLSAAYAWSDKGHAPWPDEYARVRAENDWSAQQVAQFPARLVAFCGISPIRDYALEEVRRCASELHARGVKMHFSNSGVELANPEHLRAVQAVFAEANRLKLALVVHLQTEKVAYGAADAQIFLNEVLPKAPDIVVQIAHMAGSGPGWNDEAFEVYADAVGKGDPRTARLYFDVATCAEEQSYSRLVRLAQRIRQVGINRILYGSDASFGNRATPRQEWATFQGYVPLSQAELAAIASNVAPYLSN